MILIAQIYKISNDINNKVYIGKTNFSVEKRFQEHCKECKKQRCENRPLYKAMNKYGIEHFTVEIIEECYEKDAANRERYWIEQFNSQHYGQNATEGGDGKQLINYDEVVEMYQKLGQIKDVAKQLNIDRTTVSKILKSKNIPITQAYKRAKEKYCKKVAQIDIDTGQILNIFNSITDARNWLRTIENKKAAGGSHITDVIAGRRKTAYGYKWKILEENNDI